MITINYLDEYIQAYKDKKIVLSKEMKKAIKRIETYKKKYYYDNNEALKRINFIEKECSQTKGSNNLLKLELVQKFWISLAFGFFTDESKKQRLIKEIPLIISRGSGKTTLASAIALCGMLLDNEYGADISCLASTRQQAHLLFDTARTMSNRNNTLLHLMTKNKMLTSTKAGLKFSPTNSFFRIETSNYDTLDGLNSHMVIFDEVHTYTDDFIQIVKDGSSRKRLNYQIWYITTNGTVRNGVFDKYFKFWSDILDNKIKDDSICPLIYKLDDVKEINKPRMWQKAIPMIDVLQKSEVIKKDIKLSKDDPFKQTELITKTFNIPLNNSFSFFSNQECYGNKEFFNNRLFLGNDYENAPVFIGMDLSEVNDICSISFMAIEEETNKYHFKNLKILPRTAIQSTSIELANKYNEWDLKDDTFYFHEEKVNTPDIIYNIIIDFIKKHKLKPVLIGYDKWNAKELIKLLSASYGRICIDIPQNTYTLSPLMKQYKALIKSGDICFNDDVSTWNHANVVAKIDANNNIFPNKKLANNKIDIFVSNLIALAVSKQELKTNNYDFL